MVILKNKNMKYFKHRVQSRKEKKPLIGHFLTITNSLSNSPLKSIVPFFAISADQCDGSFWATHR